LDVVADDRMVAVAVAQREAAHGADVEVVAGAAAGAVARELGVLDDDIALEGSAGENAALVVVEVAVAHRQSRALAADSRAVAVRHLGARELDVRDRRPRPLDDPDRLAFGVGAVRAQVRTAAAAP